MIFSVMVATMLFTSCKGSSAAEVNSDFSCTQAEQSPKPFSKIEVSMVADVYYTQNDGDKCEVKLDYSEVKDPDLVKELKKKVCVAYRDGGVEIGAKGKLRMKEGNRLKVHITSPDLVKVKIEGVGSFHADNINTDELEVDNEGVGSIHIGKLLANKTTVDNDGVGSVHISDAKVDRMKIENDGVGSVHAKVNCQFLHTSLDGVGSIKVSGVTRKLLKVKDGVGSINTKNLNVLE